MTYDPFIDQALSVASDTKRLVIDSGVLANSQREFSKAFGDQPTVIVSDSNTIAIARAVIDSFRNAGRSSIKPFVFSDRELYAEHGWVVQLQESLGQHRAIPIAVGSGTINDLTKLAAHRVGRPYMCVATAASMDGYTAFGASITVDGSKQTFDCPAPRAVLADLDIIANAPDGMNAWGYADLMAKLTCGADWIIADELGVEPINRPAWRMVQERLLEWLGQPEKIKRGDRDAIKGLVCGLMMSGFAMQSMSSSRPASGAEHQFSHLWDMQHATDASHGEKVGVATVAVAKLYEALMKQPIEQLDIEMLVSKWPAIDVVERQIDELFSDEPAINQKAKLETRIKHPSPLQLRQQLHLLRERWPSLKSRISKHLPSSCQLVQMLKDAGAPTRPEQIGVSPQRLRESVIRAYQIRRRFTMLDLAVRAGVLESCVAGLEDHDADR